MERKKGRFQDGLFLWRKSRSHVTNAIESSTKAQTSPRSHILIIACSIANQQVCRSRMAIVPLGFDERVICQQG
jgi:hypothetical protein